MFLSKIGTFEKALILGALKLALTVTFIYVPTHQVSNKTIRIKNKILVRDLVSVLLLYYWNFGVLFLLLLLATTEEYVSRLKAEFALIIYIQLIKLNIGSIYPFIRICSAPII